MKLTDREWKCFNPSCLVEEVSIKHKMSKSDLSDTGIVPVYSSQVEKGGIMGFADKCVEHTNKDGFYVLFGDHTREFHVVDNSFSVADNVKILKPKIDNKYAYIFIVICWKKAIPNLGYARHWRAAKRVPIMLPVTSAGEPDYDFMEQYIKDLMIQKYFQYLVM